MPIVSSWLGSHLEGAIIEGRPWKLFVRDTMGGEPGTVRYFDAATPDPAHAGSMWARDWSFDRIRDDVRTAVRVPAWSDELRIARDEPDEMLVHFPHVREAE